MKVDTTTVSYGRELSTILQKARTCLMVLIT